MAVDVRNVLEMVRGGNRSYLRSDETQTIVELNGVTLKGHGLTLISESGLYKFIMRSDKPQAGHPKLFLGSRAGSLNAVSESGLYKLVMRSDKTDAKEFQNWVTRVVLPTIRKDGAYIMGEEKVSSGEMSEDEFVLKALNILQSKIERLKKENELQAQTITDMKPAADIVDALTW